MDVDQATLVRGSFCIGEVSKRCYVPIASSVHYLSLYMMMMMVMMVNVNNSLMDMTNNKMNVPSKQPINYIHFWQLVLINFTAVERNYPDVACTAYDIASLMKWYPQVAIWYCTLINTNFYFSASFEFMYSFKHCDQIFLFVFIFIFFRILSVWGFNEVDFNLN